MESSGFVLYHYGQESDEWKASFSHENSGSPEDLPEKTLQMLLNDLESSEILHHPQWGKTHSRVFDMGFDAGDKPWAYNQTVSSQTLARMAKFDISLTITIYPELHPESK